MADTLAKSIGLVLAAGESHWEAVGLTERVGVTSLRPVQSCCATRLTPPCTAFKEWARKETEAHTNTK